MLNDVPVLSGTYQVWIQSSVLKGASGKPVYYSTILSAYKNVKGLDLDKAEEVEFCGRNINFRFPNSDNGMHDLALRSAMASCWLLWVAQVQVRPPYSPC